MAVDLSVGSRNPSAMRRYVISFLCLGHFMVPAMPSLTGVQPQAVAPGKTTEITLHGDHFTDGLRLWTSFGEKVEFVERINAKQAVFRITAPRGAVAQVGALRVYDRTGISEPILMMVDALSTVTTTSTDKTKPIPLKIPIAVDGRVGGVNSHWFSFEAKAGQKISIEVYAGRIASKADPMIRLIDPNNHEADYADDDDVIGSDAGLIHMAKISGRYLLELRDVQYRSGLLYRLRIGDFTIWPEIKPSKGHMADKEPNDDYKQSVLFEMGKTIFGNIEKPGARDHFKFKGKKGQRASFQVFSRRIGSPSYIYLELLNAAGKPIATAGTENTLQTILRHKLPADGEFVLRVEELLRRGGGRYAYRVDTRVGLGEFNLKLKSGKNTADRFWGIAGQQVEVSVQADRKGYNGPITLTVSNDWAVTGNIIGAKTNATQLKVVVPREAKPGELHHLVIRGKGEDKGTSSVLIDLAANLRQRWPQMTFPPVVLQGIVPVVVIEPVQVSIAAAKLKQGAKLKVRITTKRPPEPIGMKAAPQPIAIELKNLPAGVTAPAKVNVDAKKDFVDVELTVATDAKPAKVEIVAIAKSKYRGTEWEKVSPPAVIEVLPR